MRTSVDKVGGLILIYGVLIFSTVFVLSYLAVYTLEFYLTAFVLEFFLAILATSPHDQAESRRQLVVGLMFVVIFIGVIVRHVLLVLK